MATAKGASDVVACPSIASTMKAYSLPLILFSGAIFFQLYVLPNTFPLSHYDVLAVKRYSSIEEVREAYHKVSSKWNSGSEVPSTLNWLKIQYAYELLTNPTWKKNYDIFGVEEQIHVLQKAKEQYSDQRISSIELPLLDSPTDTGDQNLNRITLKDFQSMFQDGKPWLIQLYSFGSKQCAHFSDVWKTIAALLDGVANTALVELGEIELVAHLAEKKPTGQPFFRNGLPSIIAFPLGCKTANCLVRYNGELSVDAITDWFSTTILDLPRIFYYPKESLGQNFLAKVGPHKVKVILFSRTGERAAPFVRQAAKNYWTLASFAFVLWREEEYAIWFNAFEVESAPAIVFLKDPGVKPIVYHGLVNNSWFINMMEQNKQQELPQLRSLTSMELGCDARGYSRAGYEAHVWYCAVLAGRHGPELNKMRETLRRVQEILVNDIESNGPDKDQSIELASIALKSKRLSLAWLDGEVQKRYCQFYLHSETSYETCGPRRDVIDVPRLFIVRYKRNTTEDNTKLDKKPKGIWDSIHDQELDPASQLVARFNGSDEITEIIKWISQIVKDGDSQDLPSYRTKTPELVSEDAEPVWLKGVQNIASTSMIMPRIHGIRTGLFDLMGDPRIGPVLLLSALMSFGTIWLQRSQPSRRPTQQSQSQPKSDDESRPRREKTRKASYEPVPPSVTDMEPKDAYQMKFSDSDSD